MEEGGGISNLLGNQGSSEKAEVKRKVLRGVLNCEREQLVSDVGRKTVPDKGRLNRQPPVTKTLEFPFCTGKSFFIRTGTESTRWSVYRETG